MQAIFDRSFEADPGAASRDQGLLRPDAPNAYSDDRQAWLQDQAFRLHLVDDETFEIDSQTDPVGLRLMDRAQTSDRKADSAA